MDTPKILIVDDNAIVRATAANMAAELEFKVLEVPTVQAARELLANNAVQVLLCDDDLGPGLAVLDLIGEHPALVPDNMILMSGRPRPDALPAFAR